MLRFGVGVRADTVIAITCDRVEPPGYKSCARCRAVKHQCVRMDDALVPALNAAVRARERYAARMAGGTAAQQARAEAAAREAGEELVSQLRGLRGNRDRMAGDRPTPRKRRVGGAMVGATWDDLAAPILGELQSIRRALLASAEASRSVGTAAERLRCPC